MREFNNTEERFEALRNHIIKCPFHTHGDLVYTNTKSMLETVIWLKRLFELANIWR